MTYLTCTVDISNRPTDVILRRNLHESIKENEYSVFDQYTPNQIACVGPLYNEYNDYGFLIEFIELYQILEVEPFTRVFRLARNETNIFLLK